MTIRYTPHAEDHVAFYRYSFKNFRKIKQTMLIRMIFFIFGLSLVYAFFPYIRYSAFETSPLYYAIGLVVVIPLSIGYYFFFRRLIFRQARKLFNARPLIKEVALTVDENGYESKEDGEYARLEWNTVFAVKIDSDYVYLFRAYALAGIVPLARLGEDREPFVAKLREVVPAELFDKRLP